MSPEKTHRLPSHIDDNQRNPNDSRMCLRESTLRRSSNAGRIRTVITNDLNAAEHLLLIEEIVPKLLADTKDLFLVTPHRDQPVLRGSDRYLSDNVYQCLRRSDDILEKHFPNHLYHPWVSLYLEHKDALAQRLTRLMSGNPFNTDAAKQTLSSSHKQVTRPPLFVFLSSEIHHHIGASAYRICDALNDFVRDIRRSGSSAAFKKRVRNHHDAVDKNMRGLTKYIDSLFQHHSRLLVIRVDLGYGKDMQPEPSRTAHMTSEEVRKHRDRLLKNIPNNTLFAGLVGYVWKLEYGLEKGYHYHWLFFFDGRTRCRDVWLGQKIGEYWQKIVGETAVYWNCNANKSGYRRLGVGMINRGDDELRKNLIEAAEYLTKPDLHLRLVDTTAGRTFGRGEIRMKEEAAVTTFVEGGVIELESAPPSEAAPGDFQPCPTPTKGSQSQMAHSMAYEIRAQ